ncbi:hypothetical protein SAMN05444340_1156 [Citreimonas salinaria]|uniref:Uncharacterized protein n=2 Tax=Citreimonas salinaria TaxID=321339 RepID=A0A1H3LZY1_9RHOB|nr:hypothetical protein SAMN05444340_1156 [Citreimonas salinaria]
MGYDRQRGTTSIETAVLLAGFSVPVIIAFMMFAPQTTDECGELWRIFDDCAEDPAGSPSTGGQSETTEKYVINPGDLGDEEHDPDPGTPYSGWWTFGNGQAFSFLEEKMVIPDDPNYEHSIDSTYAQDWYAERVEGYQSPLIPLAGFNHTTGRNNGWNKYAVETRMLQLDASVDCLNSSGNSRYCQVALSNPGQNQGEDVLVGSRTFEAVEYPYPYIWSGSTFETIDYDRFSIDPSGQNVGIRDGLTDTATVYDPEGRYVSREQRWTKAEYQFQGDATVFDLIGFGRPERIIDAQQNNVGVHFVKHVELELGNGNFETNNFLFGAYSDKAKHYSGDYTYRPAPGGVVAAYPARDWRHGREDYGHGHLNDYYDSELGERVQFPAHGIDIEGTDWAIKECTWFTEAPFERETQHSTANYRTARASVGHDGLLGGPSVILENGAGATWELIYVDRTPIASCDESNPLLFRQPR